MFLDTRLNVNYFWRNRKLVADYDDFLNFEK